MSRVRLCSLTPADRLPTLHRWRITLSTGMTLEREGRTWLMACAGLGAWETLVVSVEPAPQC
jgi:hypothetical protein